MVALLSKQRSKSRSEMFPRKCFLEYDLKTLGLLLRRPNIALVTVRPFRIDPQTPTTVLPTH